MEANHSQCGNCGTALAPSEVEGLCPRCLLDLAIGGGRPDACTATAIALPAIPSGDRIGPYEILALISRGGMGEIYRANDTRLDRIVAIKLLSPAVVDSAGRRERFEREARAVSSLNHANICSLYDVGEYGDTPFLVMEYIEGETLAQRLARGPLPLAEVLRYTTEIVEALDHAHQHGVIHRDLKPANIMLTASGATLLDFGVAKMESRRVISADVRTVTARPLHTITEVGTVIGTLVYMAPEQLEARKADARTDIFALGAVMYEMVTGQRAFGGATRQDVIASILNAHPPPCSATCSTAPRHVDHIVARCLSKNPDDRWQTARELSEALKHDAAAPQDAVTAGARRPSPLWMSAAVIAALVVLTGIVLAVRMSRLSLSLSDARPFRFIVPPPEGASFNQSSAFMALSPDGSALAFVAASPQEGRNTLWVRPLDSLAARSLSGTTDAGQPFWSADGRFLVFGRTSGEDVLNRIDARGGVPRTIAGTRAAPGTWNADEVILFSGGRQRAGIYRVQATGGPPVAVTSLDPSRAETAHAWPQFLPDGRRFIFLARSSRPEHDGIVSLGSLESPELVRLVQADSQAVYDPRGYLVFMRVNTLVAQRFDARTLQLSGEPVPIAEQVERTAGTFRGAFSISRTGVLAYRAIAETRLAWYDRTGRLLQAIGGRGQYSNPALSPDERGLAVGRLDFETGASDIWVIDLARQALASRLTFGATPDDMPFFQPDGRRIAFRTPLGFYESAWPGDGTSELLTKAPAVAISDWISTDGTIVYHARSPRTGLDVWMQPTTGARTPVPILQTTFEEGYAKLSPDRRWMAYVSDESGQYEVYVRAFPSGADKRQVSTEGGLEPAWSADGRELFYLALDRHLMSVNVTTVSMFDAAPPARLFETRMSPVFNPTYTRNQYVVSRDRQRFLINQSDSDVPPSPITIVVNWLAPLQQSTR